MSAPAKHGPPLAASAKLGLSLVETQVVAALAFMMAPPDSNPIDTMETMAATWRKLVSEISPLPSPRSET